MKHKLLKLNAVLLLGLGFSSLQGQTTMNVMATSNTQTNYALSTIRKLTFSGSGNMTVTNYAASVDNYMLTSVRYLMFTNGVADIKSTLADAKGSSFCLYPNPVVDVLNIQLSAMESQTATLELLSIDGKLLYKAQFNNTGSYQVNVSHLRQGIYLCRLNDGTSIETKKIVKQ